MSVLDIINGNTKQNKKLFNLPIKVTVTDLNEAQKETLKAINEHNLVLLQGGGGCGKSETLINIVCDNLAKGKKTLIVAKTDKALEVLADRLNNMGAGHICMLAGTKTSNVMLSSHLLDLLEGRVDLTDDAKGNILKYLIHKNKENAVNLLKSQNIKRLNNLLIDTEKRKNLLTMAKMSLINKRNKKEQIMKQVDFKDLLDVFGVWAVNADKLHEVLPLKKDMFDCCIGDELSQMCISDLIGAMFRSKKMIGAGDSFQLKNLCWLESKKEQSFFMAHEIPADLQLHWSYRKNSALDFLLYYAEKSIMLKENYRTPENLFAFANSEFYNNSIYCHKKPVEGAIEKVFVENAKTEENNTNLAEIEKAITIVKKIIKDCKAKGIKKSIGLIVPFNKQAILCQKVLIETIPYSDIVDFEIIASTIHSFQGGEKDYILYLTTFAENTHRNLLTFLENRNTFCVSITRAKEKMYVLYNTNNLKGGLLQKFLDSIPA